jgi:WD40 repeat protein
MSPHPDDVSGSNDNTAEELADRQFAAALAAYDEALATGQPVSLPGVLWGFPAADPKRLDGARGVLHLLDQLHARSHTPRPSGSGSPPAEPVDAPATLPVGWNSDAAAVSEGHAGPVQVIAGRYALERILGHGGMGLVYLARDRSLSRPVAVKLLSRLDDHASDAVRRFWAEAQAAGRLQHSNLVAVYDVGLHCPTAESAPRPFLVMEYLAGGSLRDRLTGQPWPDRDAAELVETLARAIHVAHQHQIIHRDLKPANILFQRVSTKDTKEHESNPDFAASTSCSFVSFVDELLPKITDFGVAKLLDSPAALTRSGDVVGTPQYMAPEQAQGRSHTTGPATDVYALGVILYELLTGRPPFQGVMALDIQLRITCEEPLPPRRLQPTVARDLETICLKCLEKDPRRRYATAEALADDLGRFQAGQPIVARPVPPWERLGKWARRQPVVAILAALVAVVTVLGVAGIAWKWHDAAAGWAQAEDRQRDAKIAEAEALALAAREKLARQATEAAEARARAQAEAEARARERTEWALYGSRLSHAMYAWTDNEPRITRELLAACPVSFRHWEYAYLSRLQTSNQYRWVPQMDRLPIQSLAVAPDGSRVLVAQAQGYLQLLALGARKPSLSLRTTTPGPCSVCFSPDGRRFASLEVKPAGPDGQLCVWDAADGRNLLTVPVQATHPSVRFSPDGERLIYAGSGTIHTLDASTGKEIRTLPGHPKTWALVSCSSDGRFLASGGGDKRVKVWDATTGQLLHTLEGHTREITALAISPDSRHLATGSADRSIRVWDLSTGQLRHVLQGHTNQIAAIDFSPDGNSLVSAGPDRALRLWDISSGQLIRTLRGHEFRVWAVAFLPNGHQVISGDQLGTLMLWDVGRDQECSRLPLSTNPVHSASLSPDGTRLAAISGLATFVRVLDAQTGKRVWSARVGKVRAVQFTPDGRSLLVRAAGRPLQCRDAASGTLQHSFAGDPSGVVAHAVDSRGQRVASIGTDHRLRVHNVGTGELLIEAEKLAEDYWAGPLCFGGDRWLILGGARGRLEVRDAATAELRRTLIGHERAIQCLAGSADGRYLASGSVDQTVKLWDAATGQERATLRGHPSTVLAVTFSPDGERLVSGCHQRAIKMWSTANGQEVLPLTGHLRGITSLSFSGDGRWLSSSSLDGTVRLWDAGEQWSQRAATR